MNPTPAMELAAMLLALAEAELRTPEGRERLAAELCRTMKALAVPCGGRCSAVRRDEAAARVASRRLIEHLTCAAEHADFLDEQLKEET